MERKLKSLFDYQKFEKKSRLEQIIKEVNDSGEELSDDTLSLVDAAGDLLVNIINKKDKE